MSTATIDAMLAEVDALDAAATPGPWEHEVWAHDHDDDEFDGASAWYIHRKGDRMDTSIVTDIGSLFRPLLARLGFSDGEDWGKAQHEANARFVSRARSLLPELAAALRESRAEVERLRAALDVWVTHFGCAVPDVGTCEYTWTMGEVCGSPGGRDCGGHSGIHPDGTKYTALRAAAALLQGEGQHDAGPDAEHAAE